MASAPSALDGGLNNDRHGVAGDVQRCTTGRTVSLVFVRTWRSWRTCCAGT